jgi:KDO2-lipid IV(A) lauroyltransferase
MSKSKLTFGQKLLFYWVLWTFRLIAIWPDFILFGVFKWIIYGLVYHVVGYRVKVVRDNLTKCFPEKTTEELRAIERGFYENFAEIIICVLNLTVVSRAKLSSKLSIKQGAEQFVTDPRHAIIMMGHCGCWEYLPAFPTAVYNFRNVCVYHELENPAMDELMKYIRTRMGGVPVERREVLRHFIANKNGYPDGGRMMWGMLSDQTPPKDPKHHWIKFLGRPTVFSRGSEFMAIKFGVPVYFLNVNRVGAGQYEYSLEMIYDGREEVAEYEITERYAQHLEQQIRRAPELWLWSHRRWKRHFSDVAKELYYERYPEDRPTTVQ